MSADPFVAQLADLCREEPVRAKWVFVPAHTFGLTLGDRLAREGCDWANLRFVTPLDIAIRMSAPFLLERGLDPSEDPLGPAFMMRLLLDLPEAGGYFRPMAEHTSMAEALWRTVRELRHAGLRAADIPAGAFTLAAKHAELVALLDAYERHLVAGRIADYSDIFDEATRRLDWCPIATDDPVMEIPDATWSPMVRRFLDALPGRRVQPCALAVPGVNNTERAGCLGANVERVEADSPLDANRLRFLRLPTSASPANANHADGTLDIFHAGGRDAEVDEVLRRIAASGQSLDRVEIACASGAYAQLIQDKTSRLGWPVTLAAGVPATRTRPGRLLLGFCTWVGTSFAAADLRRLLQSGDCWPAALESPPSGAGQAVSPGQAARLLLKAQASLGRRTYEAALTRLAQEYERRAKDSESSDEDRDWNARKAAQTSTLRAWVASVLSAVPEPDAHDHTVALATLAAGAAVFLDANASRGSAEDAKASIAIAEALDDLRALGDYRCDVPAGLRFLRERVESLAVARDRPRPGHLHVSSLADAGYDGRALVFVVGLQEGGVFPSAVEDPVLLDAERRAISPLLRTSADRVDEAVFAGLSRVGALGAAAERISLSFSCRDTREFRDTFPSWIVLQAFRLKQGDASLGYEQLAAWLGDPKSAVPASPSAAVTDAAWWLSTCTSNSAARPAVLDAFPALARGIEATKARASDAFTEFDGLAAIAGAALDPSRTARVVSATGLENAAGCPFRFFVEQGLGVRPIEEEESSADGWLDPRTRGLELHALFARIMRHARKEERKPDLKKDLPRLRKWGEDRLAELRAELPPPSDEVYSREAREFLDDLDAFLAAECDGRHGKDPVAFEVGFGFPRHEDDDEPLASDEPTVIDLGGERRVVLRGRIDRINRVGPGEYEVVDYKTGRYWAPEWEGEFAGGTRLQHALYGCAAMDLLRVRDPKARVVRGVYVFPAVRGHRRQKVIDAPAPAKTVAVLSDLMDVLAAGAFAPADAKDACKWCDFAAACHVHDVTCTGAKLESGANTVLEPYRRLRTHG